MKKPKPILDFLGAFGLADCAARIFAKEHPSKQDADVRQDAVNRRCCSMLREPAVSALRYLWRTGDGTQRALVATRIFIWLGKGMSDPASIPHFQERIHKRERARLAD